jgi:threonyl-tRNA synthetase
VLAEAVLQLYPGTRVSIGPAIDSGFYYDFAFPDGVVINDEALAAIESAMKKIIKSGRTFTRTEISRADALQRFNELGERFKVELIEDLPANETITLYTQGDEAFVDLCRGPHVQNAKAIKAVKLMSSAGAYWRGDSTREQLTRIYGTAFARKEDLNAHLENLERAKKNDHRRLGTALELFSFHEESPGSAFWHPRGWTVWNAITDMWREYHNARGYREVRTPIMYNTDLWKTSGHWEFYKDGMYITEVEDRQFGIKPMNCPAHCLMVNEKRYSWRDLPLRINEQGLVHRNEPSGTLHGLMRVRQFTQDDAHIFCAPEQVQDEVIAVLDFVLDLYRLFGFQDYAMELSTRPAKSLGSDEMWEKAEAALAAALDTHGIAYKLNPGDGAFYGPKIDFHIRDSMQRTWQCGTVQLDFSMPEKFDLTYTGEDNSPHQMVMVHRALLGSMERFFGILLEHYEGEFPLWMAPVQATVIPVSSQHHEYARSVQATLAEHGIRADVDYRDETMGRKIREGEKLHTPVLLVVGDSEQQDGTVAIRRRGVDERRTVSTVEIATELAEEVSERRLHPQMLDRMAATL